MIKADRRWFKGYEDAKDERKKGLSAGVKWFDQLREMLEEDLQAKRIVEEKAGLADTPKFDVGTMAYNLGVRRGIGIALGLIPQMKTNQVGE